MLPDATLPVPASVMNVLAVFAPLFTAPSFRTFCGLACGFLAQTGRRTGCTSPPGWGWPGGRAEAMAGGWPGRAIQVGADSAYAGQELKGLPPGITWPTRLRKDARLFALPPARTGRRGAPRKKGDRLPCLDGLAATAEFAPVTVTRYGKTQVVQAAAITCLSYYATPPPPAPLRPIPPKSPPASCR